MDIRGLGLSDDDLRQLGYRVKSSEQQGEEPRGTSGASPPGVPAPARDPALRWALVTLVLLAATAWAASPRRALPDPVPAAAPDTSFSSARAMAQLVEVARLPRPTGSPEHRRVMDHLVSRLTALGLEVEIQTDVSFVRPTMSDRVVSATVRNVVARIVGSDSSSTGAVAIIAPYDGGPLSPAAANGAFGVATILETVRTVRAGDPLDTDLIVVFTDGDDLGLLGTRAFAEHHRWASNVSVALSVDARGATGPAFAFETNADNGRLVDAFARADVRPGSPSLARAALRPSPDSVRLSPLLERGARGLSYLALGDPTTRAHPRDTPDRVDEATLQHAGEGLLSMTRWFAGGDGQTAASPDQAHFSVPLLGLVHYPAVWGLPITLGLLGAAALLALVLRYRRATARGVAAGLVAALAGVGVSGWLAGLLLDFTAGWHPEYGWVEGAFYRDGSHTLALVGVAIASVTVPYAVARRWFRQDEVVFGALLAPLALCVWLTATAPFAAAALQWPLAIAVLAAAFVTSLGPKRAATGWAWAAVVLASGIALVLVVPSLELLARAWTFRAAPRLGALFALALLLFLPMMEWLLRPRSWLLPGFALGVSAAIVTIASPSLRGGTAHPLPTSLVYLTEEPVRTVLPLSDTPIDSTSPDLRRMSGVWLTVPGPGERWARSWVAEAPTGSTDPGTLLMESEHRYEIAGAGPNSMLLPPRSWLLESAPVGNRRTARVVIASGLGGEMIGVRVPEGVDAALTGVEGVAWDPRSSPVRGLTHWGAPEHDSITVDLSLAFDAEDVELMILEHHLRPQDVLGQDFFQRPDSMIPNPALESDRVIQRTRVRIAVPDTPPPDQGTDRDGP